ncbi:hypothetical protein M433DRAFT_246472 [Acidomyces richmondensis BFW]|nr:hypothetical protein M433DRAFT_246472 [Acidomyces richmondensis BFW]
MFRRPGDLQHAPESCQRSKAKEVPLPPPTTPEESRDLDRGTAGATQRCLNVSRSIHTDDELRERDIEDNFEGN